MKKVRKALYCTVLALMLISAGCILGCSAPAAKTDAPVSNGICVMAEKSPMAMAGLIGQSISFEADDFARALNVSKIDYITVTRAPHVSEGELRVGNTVVSSGLKISASSIGSMTYVPSGECTQSSFRFSVDGNAYDMPCNLYMLSKVNYAPTLQNVPPLSLNASTHKNVALYGTLECFDSDGDDTFVEIVSYPSSGSIELDASSGEYVYVPKKDFSGKDSFVYVARDIYGNYSAAATVSLRVTRPTVSVSFDDMKNSRYYNDALTMAEQGIMSGEQVGSNTYFYPELTVSRGDFVVMAMHACGITDLASVSSTPFADDSDIPASVKSYVAAAYELGYIHGIQTSKGLCFEANRAITRAEVAVLLGNILDVATPTVLPTFSDSADIPAWAAPSIYSLSSIGVMNTVEGNILPTSALTRGEAARILSCVLRLES